MPQSLLPAVSSEGAIDYVKNPEKTDQGRLITSWQCDSRTADAEFFYSKQQYIRNTGRVRGSDDVIAYQIRQSFRPGEITPEEENRLGCELAKRFTKGNHAFIVCTHIDKSHIHNHIIWSAISLDERRTFKDFWCSAKAVHQLNDTICFENGYSIVENPKSKGNSYDKWLGSKKKPCHRERLCAAIDEAMAQNPASFEALLELLRQVGYTVKSGKVPSLLGGEQKNYIRMDTLGENYTPEVLRAVSQRPKRRSCQSSRQISMLYSKRGTIKPPLRSVDPFVIPYVFSAISNRVATGFILCFLEHFRVRRGLGRSLNKLKPPVPFMAEIGGFGCLW